MGLRRKLRGHAFSQKIMWVALKIGIKQQQKGMVGIWIYLDERIRTSSLKKWRNIYRCYFGTRGMGLLKGKHHATISFLWRCRIVWKFSHVALGIFQIHGVIFVRYGTSIRKVWSHVGWESQCVSYRCSPRTLFPFFAHPLERTPTQAKY